MIEALAGIIAALGGALWLVLRRLDAVKRDLDASERRAKAAQQMRDYEHDAAVQDDAGLADRISRRGL
jgi:hypothetical protein